MGRCKSRYPDSIYQILYIICISIYMFMYVCSNTSGILCVSLPRQVKVGLQVVDISFSEQCWKSLSLLFWAPLLQTDNVDGGDTCSCLEHLGASWNTFCTAWCCHLHGLLIVFSPPSHFAWATTEFEVHRIMQQGQSKYQIFTRCPRRLLWFECGLSEL